MKIKSIKAVPVDLSPRPTTPARVQPDPNGGYFVSPMDRYKYDIPERNWQAEWTRTACIVTAEDGTWGLGITLASGPVCSIINDHFSEFLVGKDPMSTEKIWDMMRRASSP